jgi:Family of unknown function (DUF5677)
MDFPEGFKEQGFLCADITNGIANVRAENAGWFKLAEDTNAALMSAAVAASTVDKTTSMAPEAIAVRVLLRSCGTLQGVILLTERGMVAEGRTLARSLIEDAFCIAALLSEPAIFVDMLKADSDASRRNQGKFILAEDLIARGEKRDKLQATIDAIDKKIEIMSPKKVAALGPLTRQYLFYQRLSDDAAHPSARSLHRYMVTHTSRSGWSGYKSGAGDRDENAATLHSAILAALPIGVGITQLLKDRDGNREFGQLCDRFEAMPPVQAV